MSGDRHEVASTDEFDGDGSRVIAEVAGREVAVFLIDGAYHAMLNYCIHQAGPLCEGQLTGRTRVADDGTWEYDTDRRFVTCPWHAWKFDVETGRNLQDDRYAVPTYDVEVNDDAVYVVV